MVETQFALSAETTPIPHATGEIMTLRAEIVALLNPGTIRRLGNPRQAQSEGSV
jgi:hypothetical protein